uniref:Uncharacterized protein n=1 Tax=Brassica oleracea TaxID=3712 RepID=A0A3P6F025_BRAOL|nr:unnamed protein product [Brassica oleracea]
MFPKWEFDVEDTPVENIIKLMFVKETVEVDHGLLGSHSEEKGSEGRQSKTSEESS